MVGRGRGLSQVTAASSPQTPWYCSAAIGAVLPASWCYPNPPAPHPPVYSDTSSQDAIAAGVALTQQQNADFFGALSQNLPSTAEDVLGGTTGGVDPAAYLTSGGGKAAQAQPGQADYTTLLLMGGGVVMLFLVMMKHK